MITGTVSRGKCKTFGISMYTFRKLPKNFINVYDIVGKLQALFKFFQPHVGQMKNLDVIIAWKVKSINRVEFWENFLKGCLEEEEA